MVSYAYAETDPSKAITVAVPAETIRHIMRDLLPFEIPMGENFSGVLWVQTIDKLKIGTNRVSFFMKVLGKNIEFSTKIGSQRLNLKFGEANDVADTLNLLREWIESGKIKPVIDTVYPLNQTADAHRHYETGHSKGRVVITVEHEN